MANYTAADVKKLRDATGAGMMDCKKALDEADGDFDKAVEVLRVKGEAKAAKRGAERDRHQRPGRRRRGRDDRARLRDRLRRQERAVPDPGRRHRRARRRQSRPTDVDGAARPRRSSRRQDRRREHRGPGRGHRREARAAPRGQASTARSRPTCTARPPTCRRRSACWSSSTATTPRPPAAPRCRSPRCGRAYLTRDEVPADVVENERRVAEETAREEGKPEQALPEDRRGPAERLLQGQRAARAGVGRRTARRPSRQVLDEAGVTVTRFARFEVGGLSARARSAVWHDDGGRQWTR